LCFLCFRTFIGRRLGIDQKFDQWGCVFLCSLFFTGLKVNKAKLGQFCGIRFFITLKQTLEEKVEKIYQWRLAAKVEMKRLLQPTGRSQCLRGLLKDVNIGATKAVNRLLPIADNKKVRARRG